MMINYKKGFGLLEVIVSSMILVTVVGAVVAMGSASVRGNLTASDRTTAYNLMNQCLEKVRAKRDSSWIDSSTTTTWGSELIQAKIDLISECEGDLSVGVPPVTYSVTTQVSDVAWYHNSTGTPPTYVDGGVTKKIPANIRRVSTTVKWLSESGEKELSGSTYLSDWMMIN